MGFMNCGSRKLQFRVEGEPVAQARPKFARFGHAYEEKKCKEAKENIQEIAAVAMFEQGFTKAHAEMPVILTCKFYRPVAKSKPQWWKCAAKNNLIAAVRKYKDIDNCIKLVSDALNDVAYEDDAQIVEVHGYSYYDENPHTEVSVEAFYTNVSDVRNEADKLLAKEKENKNSTGKVST